MKTEPDRFSTYLALQEEVCRKANASFSPVDADSKLGIAIATAGKKPLYGTRHLPAKGTNGWYLWWGEQSDAPDFFKPLHATHLIERCPEAIRFLALPPGYGFISDGDYVDIWFDEKYLIV